VDTCLPEASRSSFATISRLQTVLNVWIAPCWCKHLLTEVEALDVKNWLKSLPLARSYKCKIRNTLDLVNGWISVNRSVDNNLENPCKTEASRKAVPLDLRIVPFFKGWYEVSLFKASDDYVFAAGSNRAGGKRKATHLSVRGFPVSHQASSRPTWNQACSFRLAHIPKVVRFDGGGINKRCEGSARTDEAFDIEADVRPLCPGIA
jgi:hypothetical protein